MIGQVRRTALCEFKNAQEVFESFTDRYDRNRDRSAGFSRSLGRISPDRLLGEAKSRLFGGTRSHLLRWAQ